LSVVPTGAVGKASKKVGTTLASRLPKLTQKITRKIPVQRLVAKGPGPLDDAVAKSLPIKPDTFFEAVKSTEKNFQYWGGLAKATTGGLNVRADISQYGNPRELDSLGDVAPDAAGPVLKGAGRLAGVKGVGDATSEVVDAVVEVGENYESWSEEINR
jgi:hypothetical protein